MVVVEAHRASRSQLPNADGRQPRRPVEPEKLSVLVAHVQQHMPAEIFGPFQRPASIGGEPRAAHGDKPLAEQTLRTRRRRRLGTVANGEVDVLTIEIDDAIVCRDEYVHSWMALAKTGNARDQPQGGEWLVGGDGKRSGRLLAADSRHRVAKFVEHRSRGALQYLTRLGEQQGAVPALEQRYAQLFLERLHLPRQRRLRQEQLFRGPRE